MKSKKLFIRISGTKKKVNIDASKALKQGIDLRCSLLGISYEQYLGMAMMADLSSAANLADAPEELKSSVARQYVTLETMSDDTLMGRMKSNRDLKLNLALADFNQKNDPIVQTFEKLSKNLAGGSKSGLILYIYERFLALNHLYDPKNKKLAPNIRKRIIEIEKYKPYNWTVPPLDNDQEIKAGKVCFSYLQPSKTNRRRFSVTLRFRDWGDASVKDTLPLISSRLWRKKSDFFRMLYMHFLREYEVIDKNFNLHKLSDKNLNLIFRDFQK